MARFEFLSADAIFDGYSLWKDKLLVVKQEGVIEAVIDAEAVDPVKINHRKGWLSPGFVNAHCHLELSNMRGMMPEKTGMADFLLGVFTKRGTHAEQAEALAVEAADEMFEQGINAVGDISNTTVSVAAKMQGKLWFHNFIEVTGLVPALAEERFARGQMLAEFFRKALPEMPVGIVPHAPYTISPDLYGKIAALDEKLQCIHNQESAAEIEFLRFKQGDMLRLYESLNISLDFYRPEDKSVLASVQEQLRPQHQMLWIHNCYTGKEDLQHLDPGIRHYFCLCPNANLYIGNPLPNVPFLKKAGLNLCIGTDSLASNHRLSVLGEVQVLQQHFPGLIAVELLKWATSNGARALQCENRFGEFRQGMKPGILLLKDVSETGGLAHASIERLY